MELNPTCIRDIMICIEDHTTPNQLCCFINTNLDYDAELVGDTRQPMDYQLKLLEKYSTKELIYHLQYCIKADLLIESRHSDPYMILIEDLTPKGHAILAHMRPETVWQKTVKAAESSGISVIAHLMKTIKIFKNDGTDDYFDL